MCIPIHLRRLAVVVVQIIHLLSALFIDPLEGIEICRPFVLRGDVLLDPRVHAGVARGFQISNIDVGSALLVAGVLIW